MGDASVTKPKSRPEKRARKKSLNSFGSALDEVGWKPGERTLLAPGTIGPQLRARMRFEKATADITAEQRLGGPSNKSTEIEIMEEATRLVQDARSASLSNAGKFDRHDVVDAAGAYVESCVADGRLQCLSKRLPRTSRDGLKRRLFYVAVYDLIRLFAEGARLTPHHSGDAYEPLREPFVALYGGSLPPPMTEEIINQLNI